MKRIIFIGFLVVITTGAFCQIDIAAGGQLGGGILSFSSKYEVDSDNYSVLTQTDTLLAFGAFIDATYARLSLNYAMSLGAKQKLKLVIGGSEDSDTADSPDDYSWSLFNIELLGKYPIDLGSIVVWPAAGFLYSMTISMDGDGDGEADDLSEMEINDFYLSVGAGVDVEITPDLFVTGSALFNYNLTPNPTDEDLPDEVSLTSYMIRVFVGVGYKLASM
jgi:hypothetical protein